MNPLRNPLSERNYQKAPLARRNIDFFEPKLKKIKPLSPSARLGNLLQKEGLNSHLRSFNLDDKQITTLISQVAKYTIDFTASNSEYIQVRKNSDIGCSFYLVRLDQENPHDIKLYLIHPNPKNATEGEKAPSRLGKGGYKIVKKVIEASFKGLTECTIQPAAAFRLKRATQPDLQKSKFEKFLETRELSITMINDIGDSTYFHCNPHVLFPPAKIDSSKTPGTYIPRVLGFEKRLVGDVYHGIYNQNLPLGYAIDIIKDACKGAQAMHDKGYVHADLSIFNILYDENYRGLVTDFDTLTRIKFLLKSNIHHLYKCHYNYDKCAKMGIKLPFMDVRSLAISLAAAVMPTRINLFDNLFMIDLRQPDFRLNIIKNIVTSKFLQAQSLHPELQCTAFSATINDYNTSKDLLDALNRTIQSESDSAPEETKPKYQLLLQSIELCVRILHLLERELAHEDLVFEAVNTLLREPQIIEDMNNLPAESKDAFSLDCWHKVKAMLPHLTTAESLSLEIEQLFQEFTSL